MSSPTGDQLRFISSANGEQNLDAYMEAAEIGGRALGDLLSDLFDGSGELANFIALREDPMTPGDLQYQLGSGGWITFTFTPYGSPQAKEWAETDEDVLVSTDAGGNGVDEYSAKHWAIKAAASADSFDDHYLGAKAADPALDNDGDPLQDGATYWNTVSQILKFYDLGTTSWYAVGATLPDAPSDGEYYARLDGAWAIIQTPLSEDADGNLVAGAGAGAAIDGAQDDNVIMGTNAAAAMGGILSHRNVVLGNETASTTDVIISSVLIGTHVANLQTTGRITNGVYIGRLAGSNNVSTDTNYVVAIGYNAMSSSALTQGVDIVAIGRNPLTNAATIQDVIAIGQDAGQSIQDSIRGIAIGYQAMGDSVNTGMTGDYNIAIGEQAMSGLNTTTGQQNVAIGSYAGRSVSTGSYNVALGIYSLGSSTSDGVLTGTYNFAACRAMAGNALTSASHNIAIGHSVGFDITSGSYNILMGYLAGRNITSNSNNIALGQNALRDVSAAINQGMIAIGSFSFENFDNSTATGYSIAIGYEAGRYLSSANGHQSVIIGTSAARGQTGAGVRNSVVIGGNAAIALTGDFSSSVAIGYYALGRLTSGTSNTAVGDSAGEGGTTMQYSVSIGTGAMGSTGSNITGNYNVAIGHASMGGAGVSSASHNIAIGRGGFLILTNGTYNIGIGDAAAGGLTTGDYNIALGFEALGDETEGYVTGDYNIAIGYQAGATGTTSTDRSGDNNIAIGGQPLQKLTTGYSNIGIGFQSLQDTTTGYYNIALGYQSALNVTTGFSNISLGAGSGLALTEGIGNIFIGESAGENVTTSDFVICIGPNAGPTGDPGDDDGYLYIHDGENDNPLIFANFTDRAFKLNGSLAFGNGSGEIEALASAATPSVLGLTAVRTGGTNTITDFVNGEEGQIIFVLAEHTITITDNANIILNGGANFAMTDTDTLTLIQKADGNWYELARSVN